MKEATQTKERTGIAAWNIALGASLAVVYPYLFLFILFALSPVDNLSMLGRLHWLSISLVVGGVLHYFWFQRVAPRLGRYETLKYLFLIHVFGGLGALALSFVIGFVIAMSIAVGGLRLGGP